METTADEESMESKKRSDATIVPEPLELKNVIPDDFEFSATTEDTFGSPDSMGMTQFLKDIDELVRESGIQSPPSGLSTPTNEKGNDKSWDKYDAVDQEDFLSWLGDGKVDPSKVLHGNADADNFLPNEKTSDASNTPSESPSHNNVVERSSSSVSVEDTVQVRQHNTLAKLSAALQEPENASPHQIIQLCQQLGGIPGLMRGRTWALLLGISSTDDDEVAQERDTVAKTRSNSHEVESIESSCLSALAESAVLRMNHCSMKFQPDEIIIRDDVSEASSVYSKDSADERNSTFPSAENVGLLVRSYCSRIGVSVTACDPGIADVVCLLAHPALGFTHSQVVSAAVALQQFGLISLAGTGESETVPSNRLTRSIRNAKFEAEILRLLEFHDQHLAASLGKFMKVQQGVKHLELPWRWWTCAFAGELRPLGLLELWDQLIFDCSPVRQLDTDLGQPSNGTFADDTADPRGPILSFFIVAVIISMRETLLQITEEASTCNDGDANPSQSIIDALRSFVEGISKTQVGDIVQKAQLLRNSTPLMDKEDEVVENSESSTALENDSLKATSFADRMKLKFGLGTFKAASLIPGMRAVTNTKATSEKLNRNMALETDSIDNLENSPYDTQDDTSDEETEEIDEAALRSKVEEQEKRSQIAKARHQLNGCGRGLVPWAEWVHQGGLISPDTILVPVQQKCSFASPLPDILEWENAFLLMVFNRVVCMREVVHTKTTDDTVEEQHSMSNESETGKDNNEFVEKSSLSGELLADALCEKEMEVLYNVHGSQFARVKEQTDSAGSLVITLFYIDYEALGNSGSISPHSNSSDHASEPEQSMCQFRADDQFKAVLLAGLEACNCFT